MSTRVVFTFDDESYATLQKLQKDLKLSSMAETVRESLKMMNSMAKGAKDGYTEVVLRNPTARKEKEFIDPLTSRAANA
jgi:hypothetical protein